MKKLIFTLGLCLVAVVCFGQKKAVANALKLAKDAKPNFTEARTIIKSTLQHPETKDDARTWFTAGQIENLEFDKENTKQILGQQPDEAVMYNALNGVFPYFLKAYELDLLPDAKGKVKPKFTKDMKAILTANLPYYLNGGSYFYMDVSDYQKAYEFFDQYVTISDSPLLQDGVKANAETPIDSNYIYANYYTVLASLNLEPEIAIKAMIRASKQEFKRNEVLQYLAETYLRVQDSINYEKTNAEGLALFPTESYFLRNMISIYVSSGRNDKAAELIQAALRLDQNNSQLLDVAGQIYEVGFNDLQKAEEYYLKSIAVDGENADAQYNLGRVYYNQGVAQLDVANQIPVADVQRFNQEKEKAKDLFRKALPYFEKIFPVKRNEVKSPLLSIYYNLEMSDKFEEISKLMEE